LRVQDGRGGADQQTFDLDVARREHVLFVRGTDKRDRIEMTESDGIVGMKVNDMVRA
jgi:hypothetical protein